jgi:hypothetical protein
MAGVAPPMSPLKVMVPLVGRSLDGDVGVLFEPQALAMRTPSIPEMPGDKKRFGTFQRRAASLVWPIGAQLCERRSPSGMRSLRKTVVNSYLVLGTVVED